MATVSKETRAAKALLSYFNYEMARKITRRVLAEVSPEAKRRFADAVFDLVPKAAQENVWPILVEHVNAHASRYLETAGFATRAQKFVESNIDRWLTQALDTAVKERALRTVESHVKTYEITSYVKTLSGRYQAIVEAELAARARQEASKVA